MAEAAIARPDRRGLAAVRKAAPRYSLLLVLLGLIAGFSLAAPDTFATVPNLKAVFASQAILLVVAIGLTFPLATGEFDLSFGSIVALASSLFAVLTVNEGWAVLPAIVAVLIVGVCVGLVNSALIVWIGVPSLVATLGTMTILTGLTLAATNSQVIAGESTGLTDLLTSEVLGLPVTVLVAFGIAFAAWYVYRYTPLGRYIYFVGEGREVARLSGLPVNAIRVGALVTVAVLCTVAGVLNYATYGSADPNIGASFLLPGFAAVFLGATAIVPGRFNVWGTVIAVYVLVVGVTGVQLLGAAGWAEDLFNGGALILAVAVAQVASRMSNH